MGVVVILSGPEHGVKRCKLDTRVSKDGVTALEVRRSELG
jgi:hypothetical protein